MAVPVGNDYAQLANLAGNSGADRPILLISMLALLAIPSVTTKT
jgi:hypothetical protein